MFNLSIASITKDIMLFFAIYFIGEYAGNMFYHYLKTKTEKPLKILVLVKSECTADCLATMIANKYNRIIVYTHGTFKSTCGKIYQRRIRFQNGEYWQIVTYFEDELEYFDFNVFDRIILSLDLSMDVYQKIANKVSNHTKLRVCDLCDVINKISKE